MNNSINTKLLCIFLFFNSVSHCQDLNELEPGVDRWKIKVSAEKYTTNDDSKLVSLNKLLTFPLVDKKYNTSQYDNILIPVKIGSLKEGDIISIKGYLHLVALEKASSTHKDGDYHIQITLNSKWSDSCFIVEIPYEQFISDKTLKSLCKKNRSFIRSKLLHNDKKEPSTAGNIMKSQVYVKVTGQLFYDAIHAAQMGNPDPSKRKFRGKKGTNKTPMHSYTAWEIHPVTNIEFTQKNN